MTRKKRLHIPTMLLIILSLLASTTIPFVAAKSTDVLVYGGSEPQNEVSIAVNPLNPDNIVVGFNDYNGVTWQASYAYSVDGGDSWTYGGMLPRGSLAADPFCDPWLDFDSEGYLYYVALSNTKNREVFVSVAPPNANGIVGPQGFVAPQIVDAGDVPVDKPAIAVDRTGGAHDGQIYVVWARNSTGNGFRIFFRSGQRAPGSTAITWNTAQQVGPDTFTQQAQVAVGPTGQVYVAYMRQTTEALDTADAQLFSYSMDGGATFTTNIFVSSVTPVQWSVYPHAWARHVSFPILGVSNKTGTIFIVWADRRNGDDDILLSRSKDEGKNWFATPKRVNTDPLGNGKDQWQPALTVNSLGILDIAFYDRRDDPNNKLTTLYVARSTDEGDTFKNYCVADTVTNPDVFDSWQSGCLGDYNGITSVGNLTCVSWGDGRNGKTSPIDFNSNIYFDKFDDPSGEKYIMFYYDPPLLRVPWPPWIPPGPLKIDTMIRILPTEGFEGMVNLTIEGGIPYASYSFNPSSGVPPFNSALTMNVLNATEGTYIVNVTASYGMEGRVITPVQVVITSKTYAFLETTTANPGEDISLEGHIFTANSSVDIFFDGKLLKTVAANSIGTLATTITVPIDTPEGLHTVLIKDAAGIQVSATLRTPIKETEGEEEKPYYPPTGQPSDELTRIIDFLREHLLIIVVGIVIIVIIAIVVVTVRRRK